ncbi:hypothetical protein M3Y99_00532100 [Aphelenchoides fujianensis]|nr:hypothetical protein M3Y99_00532100 [Aphelenchoides fujianensis]
MSGPTAESQFVVHFFAQTGLDEKQKFRETYAWREGRQIGNVVHSFTALHLANHTTVRISDGQHELAGDEAVKPGGEYTIEMKEATIGVQVKVNDGETKQVNVPQSLVLSELCKSQNVRAASISHCHPAIGYFREGGWDEPVQKGAWYWIQTTMYPGIWSAKRVAAAFCRLLPAKKDEEWVNGREAALNSRVPTKFFEFLWISGTTFIVVVLLISLFVSIARTPSEGEGVKQSGASSAPAYTSQSIDTGNAAILAMLHEMNGKLDAERAEQTELRNRLQRMEDEHKTERAESKAQRAELLATIGKLEERVADLHQVNVSIAPTPLYTCEPKPQLTAKTAGIFGLILLVLFIMACFCKYMESRQRARRGA